MMIALASLLAPTVTMPAELQRAEIDSRYSPGYNRCMKTGDAAKGITLGIMNCNGLEIDRQDALLNRTYKTLIARLAPQPRDELRKSERVWVKQRDARCSQASAPEQGGTMAAITYSSCILDETIQRRIWLERYRG